MVEGFVWHCPVSSYHNEGFTIDQAFVGDVHDLSENKNQLSHKSAVMVISAVHCTLSHYIGSSIMNGRNPGNGPGKSMTIRTLLTEHPTAREEIAATAFFGQNIPRSLHSVIALTDLVTVAHRVMSTISNKPCRQCKHL